MTAPLVIDHREGETQLVAPAPVDRVAASWECMTEREKKRHRRLFPHLALALELHDSSLDEAKGLY